MQKKLHKPFSITLMIILFLSFSFFFVGCGKKQEETLNIPESDVFGELAEYVEKNGTPKSKNNASASNYEYTFAEELIQDFLFSFKLLYSKTNDSLTFNGFDNFVLTFKAVKNRSSDYNTSTSFSCKVEMQDRSGDTLDDWKVYYYNFELTLPAVKLQNLESSTTLPAFTNLKKTDKITGEVIPKVPAEEITKLRNYCIKYYNDYFAELNKFYIEKIKGGDQRYNGAIYKYFYLPVKLTA